MNKTLTLAMSNLTDGRRARCGRQVVRIDPAPLPTEPIGR